MIGKSGSDQEVMKLMLQRDRLAMRVQVPLQVESVSPSGLVVLTAERPPAGFESSDLGGHVQDGECLTFVLEKDGHRVTLQGTLVWLELKGSADERNRELELIVDTGGWPGWGEVQDALTGK